MTVLEYINGLVKNGVDMESDTMEKIVYLAYWIGREKATKQVSDDYTAVLSAQIERANNCRYKNMAMTVQGGVSYLYHSDYSQSMTTAFGSDETVIATV